MPVITLPRSAIKKLTDEVVVIEIPENILRRSYADIGSIRKSWGLLKGKASQWLEYVEQSRKEWDRER